MKYLVLMLIHFYRKCISPLKPPCCRFYPTCSNYAVQAVQRFGAVKGLYLAVRRLLRCHPWNIGGIDYVPERFPGFVHRKVHRKPFGSLESGRADDISSRKGNHST